ncbi:MAG: protoporphyrinogen oxidase [Bacteroidales bacterium]|nr:protoporphyrinogen oxidase [Bacteroidales bacterium]
MKIKTDIIILGAGLTGLTMAYYLKKSGRNVIVIEKESRAGGVINTISADGFIYETGPNTGVLSTPEIARLFKDLNGNCDLDTANPKSKKRYILKKGKWQPLPSGLFSAVTTPLFTLKDKFRILAEPFRRRGDDPDETLAQLVKRRMGKSYLHYAVDPFISGIYAGDPASLVTRYAMPKLYALEQKYGSFIGGAIKKAREPKSEDQKRATGEVFSVKGGLEKLISALVNELTEKSLIFNVKNLTVEPRDSEYTVTFRNTDDTVEEIAASYVVTTFGGISLKNILPFIQEQELNTVLKTKYAAVVQVAAGYKTWKGMPLDAFGGLIPTLENRGVLGILFPSAIFKGRAPENGALISVFLGGIKKPDIISKTDQEIKEIVMKEIRETLLENSEPDLFEIFRYTHAIPQYEISSGERLECIRKIQDQYPGLILAGNIRDGIGMADRVKQGKAISEILIQQFNGK